MWAGVGWRSRDRQGYGPYLCSWASPLGCRWGGREGIQGSWGSDPTSSHLSAQPISELLMQYKQMHTHIHSHIYRCTPTHRYTCTLLCTQIHAFTCSYLTHMHSDVCIQVYKELRHVYKCTHTYRHVHTLICTETCTLTCAHALICMHTQVQTSSGPPLGPPSPSLSLRQGSRRTPQA